MKMVKVGEPCGPLGLPASYTKEQLKEYGWCPKKQEFTKPKAGPTGSRLNDNRWQDGEKNRSRLTVVTSDWMRSE